MSGATTRWWENYLVRYFMPSIAGVVAVSWLAGIAREDFCKLLHIPASSLAIDAPTLTLLFLYGNLFCYVSSYPILVFHATRVIDFHTSEIRWKYSSTDGYVLTMSLALLAFILAVLIPAAFRYWGAYLLAMVFAILQLVRLRLALKPRRTTKGLKGQVSTAFAYAYSLARRRGVRKDETSSNTNPQNQNDANLSSIDVEDDENDEKIRSIRVVEWRAELIDTYRHMREHGNSAFIFLLELILAALVFCILKKPGLSTDQQLSSIGVLFAIWALPSIFVHLAGQQIERRFSRYESR